jgi:hypothetical protein
MNKIDPRTSEAHAITVGELISQLCRCPDHATVRFRCPLQHQELRFYRLESRSGVVEIELDPAPDSAPVVPA